MPNINCKYYDNGRCSKKDICGELRGELCEAKELHPKPPAPPPPPPKQVIKEDVALPLTEGKVRGGMSNRMKKTYSRPMQPPPAGKKDTTKKEILKKVEQKEFISKCVAVDICPICGDKLHPWDEGKICGECDVVFSQK